MMSLETIHYLAAEQARKAAKGKKQPQVAFMDGDKAIVHMPNIGHYRPKGWHLVDNMQVDKYGVADGISLGLGGFLAGVKEGLGYAVIEEGEFQIVVGVFERSER